MSIEEWRALPWWQRQLYVEQHNEAQREQDRAGSSGSGYGGGGGAGRGESLVGGPWGGLLGI